MDFSTILLLAGIYLVYKNYIADSGDGGNNGGKTPVPDPTTNSGGGGGNSFPGVSQVERDIVITPEVVLNEVTGNEWTGYIDWHIKNKSTKAEYVITKICSNLYIDEYPTYWIPGNNDAVRKLGSGKEITIRSTWQGKRWYLAGDTQAKNAIREKLRSQLDHKFDIVTCDVNLWLQGANGVGKDQYTFVNCKGTALLQSGALKLVSNQGEDASDWDGIVDLVKNNRNAYNDGY